MNGQPPLILIRHGQAEHQVQDITGGWSDTSLTALGETQISWLAERLRRELDGRSIFLGCSNLRRAVQTAQILADSLGLAPVIHPELTDLNNGAAAGKTHAEAKELAFPLSDPVIDWRPYPEAETWREFYQRVAGFLDGFTSRLDRPAVLVTHFANIDVITSWWLGLPVDSLTHFEIDPASLTVLTTSRYGERAVDRLNDTAHLYARGMHAPLRLYPTDAD